MLTGMEKRHTTQPELFDPDDAWQSLRTISAPLLDLFHVKACCTAAATALLGGPRVEKENVDRPGDRADDDAAENETDQHRAYIKQRLRDTAAFEARASGATPHRWKRKLN